MTTGAYAAGSQATSALSIKNSMFINTKALVLRSVQYKESSRILTVLTPEHGKLTVSARGAVRKTSRVTASVQPLAFSDMTLSKTRDRYLLTESQIIEQFDELSTDLERFALAAYFTELLDSLSDEDSPNPELLSLGLNALHMLCRPNERPNELIKAAFELRAMCLSGYAPALESCVDCGVSLNSETALSGKVFLDLYGGDVYCERCAPDNDNITLLSADAFAACRYICACEAKRLYSFTLEAPSLLNISAVCEGYILAQLDRKFNSLDYYYKIKGLV